MRRPRLLSFIANSLLLALLGGCVSRGPIGDPAPPQLPGPAVDPQLAANRIVTSLLIRSPLRRLDATHRVATELGPGSLDLDEVWLRLRLKLNSEPHIELVESGESAAWILRGKQVDSPDGPQAAVALFPADARRPVWTFRQSLSGQGN